MKKLVFIDESGNPGIKDEQGQFVIVGILVVDEESLSEIDRAFIKIKKKMSWDDNFEFKFSKTKKEIIFRLLKSLQGVNFEIYVLIFDKKSIDEKGQTIYNRLLCDLIKGMNVRDAEIMIDGKTSRAYRKKTAAFIRKELSLRGNRVRYGNSKSYNGLQLADLVAGAIHRFYEGKKMEIDYMNIIKDKIRFILRR